jgi:rare lipoprotein A
MDTMVKVTNLQNHTSVIVRINDRGPFVRGRIIDCSYQAGKQIGLDGMGIAKVSIQVVGFAGKVIKPKAIAQMKKEHKPIRVQLSNFGIQVGAFRRYTGAKIYQRRYTKRYPKHRSIIKTFSHADGEPLYRVWMMGYGSEEEAEDFRATHRLGDAFIIRN